MSDDLSRCVLCGREIERDELMLVLMEHRVCRKHFVILFVVCTETMLEEMEAEDVH
jgi:hypothetical protein